MFCANCGTSNKEGDKFCLQCGSPLAEPVTGTVKVSEGGRPTHPSEPVARKAIAPDRSNISPKSRLVAALLSLFFGTLGAARIYVGKTRSGVVMLVLGLVGYATIIILIGIVPIVIVAIWAWIDFFLIVSGNFKDKYGRPIKKW